MPDTFSLLISGSWLYYTVFALLILVVAVLYYRITIPVVSRAKRYFLLTLRLSILLILLMLMFSPVLNLGFSSVENPVNYFFIDRSASVNFDDGTKRSEALKQFMNDLATSSVGSGAVVHTFSGEVDTALIRSSNDLPKTDGNLTNLESVFKYLKSTGSKNYTVTLITDGVITDGNDPMLVAEKSGMPVFTVAIGDSTARKDVAVENVSYSEYVIRGSSSPVSPTINIAGFPGSEVKVELTENGAVVATETVSLEKNGTTSVIFNYVPKTTGMKKLAVRAQTFPEEVNKANNSFPFFINVIDNRKKVLVLSGAPTPDVAFVKNALSGDSTITVRSMTFDAGTVPLEKDINNSVFDSTGVLYLLNYPSAAIPAEVADRVIQLVSERNIPFFILINQYSDMVKLKKLEPFLPVTIAAGSGVDYEGQPGMTEGVERDPIFYTSSPDAVKEWESLPPVYIPNIKGVARPESKVLARVKLNSKLLPDPLIVSRNFGSKRSVAIIAADIWKWKLRAKNEKLFDDFLFSSAKWLGAVKDRKQFTIRTNKRFYSRNEQVEFIAEAYNESFDPLSDAEVKVDLTTPGGKTVFTLSPAGAGVYLGVYKPESPGDHSFSAVATLDGKPAGTDQGIFNVGDVDIEMLDPYTNTTLLRDLSAISGGSFYTYRNYLPLFDELKKYNEEAAQKVKLNASHQLWSNPWLLGLLVLLLSAEWFFRKREGMA